MLTGPQRCAVLGSPVAHSLSPVLHRVAYQALGLQAWTYDRVDVAAGGLAAFVEGLGPEWRGFSVTMPLKEEALALASWGSDEGADPDQESVDHDARVTRAANTLVRRSDGGWAAANTDVSGLRRALEELGAGRVDRATVVGGGATARSAVCALAGLGAREVTLLVRDEVRPGTAETAAAVGVALRVRRLAEHVLPLRVEEAGEVVVGTLPAGAPAPTLGPGSRQATGVPLGAASSAVPGTGVPVLLDAVYTPWPSALSLAVARTLGEAPGRVARGTLMLLHQAVRQVELMTGRRAPVAAMRAALAGHLDKGGLD